MSEVWRLQRLDPKFGKGLGKVNEMASDVGLEFIAEPLLWLKSDVEHLLASYEPPVVDHRTHEVELSWRGFLWKMALEAALGVQYLHHHRYERRARPFHPPPYLLLPLCSLRSQVLERWGDTAQRGDWRRGRGA
jgi:hypothetical protein